MHTYRAFAAADIALVAATPKTCLILSSAATRRFKIKEAWASFSSITATDAPVLCEICRFTNAGTGATGVTPAPEDGLDPAALTTAAYANTGEPAGPTVLHSWYQSPIGTVFAYQAPLGEEITAKVSDFIGLRLTAPSAQTGVRVGIKIQE